MSNRFIGVFLVDVLGIFFLQFNSMGFDLVVFSLAYVFCVAGFYVIYRVFMPVGGG